MIGRRVSPVEHDRTRPVVKFRVRNLTGNDRTLRSSVRSLRSSVFGHHLTIGIGCSVFEERGHVVWITRPDAGVLRPVSGSSECMVLVFNRTLTLKVTERW